jgi:hypothetical protein
VFDTFLENIAASNRYRASHRRRRGSSKARRAAVDSGKIIEKSFTITCKSCVGVSSFRDLNDFLEKAAAPVRL